MNVIVTGGILVLFLFCITTLGKKLNEPFTMGSTSPDVLLNIPLKSSIHAQDVNYGELNKYRYETPLASYAQITNNKRYWDNPENGTALYPPINGTSLYKV
jgi:hypothetical protein